MNRYFTASLALVLGATGLGAMAGAATAAPRDDVLSAAQRCSPFYADDRRWLDCYYGAAQAMRAQLGLPPAPAAQVVLVPPAPPPGTYVPPPMGQDPFAGPRTYGVGALASSGPPPMKKDNGGFLSGILGIGQPVVSNLRLSSYTFDKSGRFTITLSDGEVWQEILDDQNHASWHAPAATYVVNIYVGAAGTFNLETRSDTNAYKVKRIK